MITRNPFTLPFERLPTSLPIFPLPHAVVMPGAELPLNIFERRYLNMVFDALGAERMIGMVQPDPDAEDDSGETVYGTGTAGRITSFSETGDGRLLIILSGVCRFDIREEVATTRGYRRVLADWTRFHTDYQDAPVVTADRERLKVLLKLYFSRKKLETDWETLDRLDLVRLINLLTGQLPLEVAERQTLIEAVSADERAEILMGLLEFATADAPGSESRH